MEREKKKWYKRWWAIVLYVFIFLVIIASNSDDNSSTKTTDNKQVDQTVTKTEDKTTANEVVEPIKEKTYQELFTFSGNGPKKSEPFIITGDRFKIKYDCAGSLCQAFLRNTKSEFDLQLIMNSANSVKDETIIYKSGEYYIDANTVGNYTMTVEDYK